MEDPLTEIWLNVAGPTTTAFVPETVPSVAVIVTVPAATPVTSPDVLTVASVASEVFHDTCEVRLPVLPSL